MPGAIVTRRMALAPDVELLPLLGRNDDHLRTVESELDVQIVARGHEILIKGAEGQVRKAERLLGQLADLVRAGTALSSGEVLAALRMVADDAHADIKSIFSQTIAVPSRRKLITPKSLNQRRYLEAVRTHDLVFAIGPAGTGKSYLGVAMAVAALTKRAVTRIVLTRPAVEAGERLGFLPGDLYEKVHPYLRPLYDALYDMLEAEKVASLTEKGAIEIAPLAYMRGRTLNDSFIILDEAQNATSEQMKMCLTRLGFNSKMVVTGDITQVDLPSSRTSGLIEIQSVLAGVPGISFVYFNDRDVVRHQLVSAIIRAYDAHEAGRAGAPQVEPGGSPPERAPHEARPGAPDTGGSDAGQPRPRPLAHAPEEVGREADGGSVPASLG
jgi:phosphate starvation-inducible PhoH-like protein